MTEYGHSRCYEDYHDEILDPKEKSILECLGDTNYGAQVFTLDKTKNGYRFVECCDGYYGVTLNEEQFRQLIKEMSDMLDAPPNDLSDTRSLECR